MFKSLISLSLLLLPISYSLAKVELQWLSIAGVALDDGESKILFDPTFSRPNWRHWLLKDKFKPDMALLKQHATPELLDRVKGVFLSHSHFDHAVDAPTIAKWGRAPIYGDENVAVLVKAHADSAIIHQPMQEAQAVTIGKFTITPIKRPHTKLMDIIDFLPGKMAADFDFDFYDYKEGTTFLFLVEHPEGKILLDIGQNGHVAGIQQVRPDIKKVDVLVQGYYKNDSDVILNGNVKAFNPSTFVPVHFDNFFRSFQGDDVKSSLFLSLKTMQLHFKKARPDVQVLVPKFSQKVVILGEIKRGAEAPLLK